jgi:hypothetical protein
MAKKSAKKPDPTGVDPEYSAYLAEITLYDRDSHKFTERGKKINRRYLDERNDAQLSASRFNILWSNTETLVPACYAKTPVPIVERRYKDKDPVARWGSEVIERALTYFMDCGQFSSIMEQCVIDKLLPGRGTAWVRYVPKIGAIQVEGNETEPGAEEVYDEEVVSDYVHWTDFGHNVSRTWDEVWLVWRKVYLTRQELVTRFGEIGNDLPLDYTPDSVSKDAAMKKACIYECWDKKKMRAVWLSKGHQAMIDKKDDPLELPGFFPSPRPMFATLNNTSLFPVAYYTEYQDQANELDNLTSRITSITKALKVAGVYDVSAEGMARLLSEGVENQLIPVERYSALKDKGGLQGSFELWPLDQIADTLMKLYQARDQVKQDLYEISGMPDIIRGSSNPEETATAQKIKGQFGSMRLRKMQDDVQRYCRDVLVLQGCILAKQFSWKTLRAVTGIKLLTNEEKQQFAAQAQAAAQAKMSGNQPMPVPQASGAQAPPAEILELLTEPTWEDVEALLRDNAQRGFRVDIETDSTIGSDDETEKANRMEYIQSAQQMITQAIQGAQQQPELAQLSLNMLMFGLRSFKSGRTLEGQIENTLSALEEKAKTNPAPDPNQQAMDQMNMQMQLEQVKQQGQQQTEQMKIQAQAALAQRNAELQNQLEASKQAFQAQQAAQETQLEAQRNAAERDNEMALEQFKINKQMELEQFKANLQAETQITIARINAAAKVQSAEVQAQPDPGIAEPYVASQEAHT